MSTECIENRIVFSILLDSGTALQVTAYPDVRPVRLLTQVIAVADATENTPLDIEKAKHRPGSSDHLHAYLRTKLEKCLASKRAALSITEKSWGALTHTVSAALQDAARMFGLRFPADGHVPVRHRSTAHKILLPSESVIASGIESDGEPVGRTAAVRELLAARQIQHGFKQFLECSQSFEHRKQRLALTVTALERADYHTPETISSNVFFQGPFYLERSV